MEPPKVYSVQNLLKAPLSFDEKLLVKKGGRPIPDLQISSTSASKTRTYRRVFNRNIYEKYEWMCGCSVTNKLFCFMCLIFKEEVSAWNTKGLDDLKHMAERAKKHENSVSHMNACMDFSLLGKGNIREQLGSAYLRDKIKHNENVEKNRHILRRLIMCIKFCGAFELALRRLDETLTSDNPGIYVGLVNFASELDAVLAANMEGSQVFKGASKTIKNELLDAMLHVYKQEVLKEIQSANFIALEADETTDTSNPQQMVVIIRYVLNGQICERFWSFFKPGGHNAGIVANTLLNELETILNLNYPASDNNTSANKNKLIAQTYDGASVMSGKINGVQAIIKRTFLHAHYIHSYAHQFNLIIERAAQCNKNVKVFFANLQSFSRFFSRTPKRTAIVDEIVQHAPTRGNFKSRTVNALFEHQHSFREWLDKIIDEDGTDSVTISEASGLLNHLNCPDFLYWLKIFHFIMPHAEILFNHTEIRGIESAQMQAAVEEFQEQIMLIRKAIVNINHERINEEPTMKRQKLTAGEDRADIAREVCDTILSQIVDRFDFKDHLSAAKLFDSKKFKTYRRSFPQRHFDETVKSYPMLDSVKLKSELSALYARDNMCDVSGLLPFLVFITDNDLKKVMTETYKLLDIICTTPMPTTECERCPSTLKRIKTFLNNVTISEDRLNALAVLSIEKKFVQSIPDFDNKVIEVFSRLNNRRMDFMYKK
ncbi:uncharacterized protein LOC116166657 isoform X1 [Photinus pyralis]|uniref:uncharacterized protein LOC116166657 isoform X1 n=1 Tax=Photinus pyralis TaxID=7054 RepID=UPI001266E5BE|nr:uncharacterized protein LOC116166657 isoform X1 [Photinus pyralis]